MQLIKNIITELKQTTWITPRQLLNLVVYTLVVCGIIATFILGLDFFLSYLRDLIL